MAELLAGLDREARNLVVEMTTYGWAFRRTSKGHLLGTGPDGSTMTIPAKMSAPNRTKQNTQAAWQRWLREHTTERIRQEAGAMLTTARASAEAAVAGDDIASSVLAGAALKHSEKVVREERDRNPIIVSRHPWMARKGGNRRTGSGRMYESQAVVEREWSDGTKDYECAFEGCAWNHPDPVSVARHYGRSHGAEHPASVDHPPVVEVPVYEETGRRRYQPTERLVAVLAEYLAESGATDPMGMAYAALQWAHDRPDLEDVLRPEREPLTDTQIVERVRALVGQPFATQVEALTRQVASLTEELAVLQAENERLANKVSEWRTLADMLREEAE